MIVGIFVGGASRRMGGQPKGLLQAPDTGELLVVRLARLASELGLEPVLVGAADAYRAHLPALRQIADRPAGIGPLGGLAGLLAASAPGPALAIACDMPYVSRALLARLVEHSAARSVLAPRSSDGRWEPLCARYDAGALCAHVDAAIGRGVRSFQRLFDELEIEELTLDPGERRELTDWDAPDDLTR